MASQLLWPPVRFFGVLNLNMLHPDENLCSAVKPPETIWLLIGCIWVLNHHILEPNRILKIFLEEAVVIPAMIDEFLGKRNSSGYRQFGRPEALPRACVIYFGRKRFLGESGLSNYSVTKIYVGNFYTIYLNALFSAKKRMQMGEPQLSSVENDLYRLYCSWFAYVRLEKSHRRKILWSLSAETTSSNPFWRVAKQHFGNFYLASNVFVWRHKSFF